MKHLLTFNESLRDLMKPKSEEEISKEIGDLNPNDLLKKSLDNNYLNGIKLALEKGADPSADNNYAIRWASQNGHIDIVKLLLTDERVDPSANNNYAIIYSSNNGNTEIVKLLLQDKRVDPSDVNNSAIIYSSNNGNTEIVKLLLQDSRVNPSGDKNYAIKFASENGHIEVVKLLLQDSRVNPSADNNYAIRYASKYGYTEIVRLLLKDERVINKLSNDEIKKYKDQISGLNESVRDLMKPKSEDEIRDIIKEKTGINKDYIEVKIPEPKELRKVKTLLELSDEYKLDIKDYKDGDILMCGDIISVFNFMKFYLNYALLNKRNSKNFYIEYILKNSVNSITESLRDLMKPKSDDEILKNMDNLSPTEILKKSCKSGYLKGVQIALEKGADPSENSNYAIRTASLDGYTEIVRLLLQDKRVDPSDDNNSAIKWASKKGRLEIVKLLLQDKRVDPSANNNSVIMYASYNGHIEVVKLLLQDERVNPSDQNNHVIRIASENKHIEIVKSLLQDKKVREKLTDKEIKKYEKQISVLNESIRDLMKPKSEEEISSALDKLSLKQKMDKLIDNGMLDRVSNEELKDYALSRKNAYEKILAISTLKIDHLFTDDELINLLRQHTANHYEMTYGLIHNRIKIVEDAIKKKRSWSMSSYIFTQYGLYSTTELEFAALKGYKNIVELLIKHGYHAYNIIPSKANIDDNYVYYELTDVLGKIGYSDIRDLLIEKNAIIDRSLKHTLNHSSFIIRIYSLPK